MTSLLRAFSNRLNPIGLNEPMGNVKIDWNRAPRGLQSFFLFSNLGPPFDIAGLDCGANAVFGQLNYGISPAGPTLDVTSTGATILNIVSNYSTKFRSLEAWVFVSSVVSTSKAIIAIQEGITSQGNGTCEGILFLGSSGFLSWYIFPSGVTITSGSTVSVGLHHIVGTNDGTTMKLYLDGVMVASGPIGTTYAFSIPSIYIGYGSPASGGNVPAAFPYLSVAYANAAWTDAEIFDRFSRPYDFIIPDEGEIPALMLISGSSSYGPAGVVATTAVGTLTPKVSVATASAPLTATAGIATGLAGQTASPTGVSATIALGSLIPFVGASPGGASATTAIATISGSVVASVSGVSAASAVSAPIANPSGNPSGVGGTTAAAGFITTVMYGITGAGMVAAAASLLTQQGSVVINPNKIMKFYTYSRLVRLQ